MSSSSYYLWCCSCIYTIHISISLYCTYLFTEVDPQIPWCKKGPNAPNNQVKVINTTTQPSPISKTGVSRAALKYEPSDNIKRLAKHRIIPKVEDDKQCFSVKPLSLIYKPSPRINQLSMPRIRNREVKKWSWLILVIITLIIILLLFLKTGIVIVWKLKWYFFLRHSNMFSISFSIKIIPEMYLKLFYWYF